MCGLWCSKHHRSDPRGCELNRGVVSQFNRMHLVFCGLGMSCKTPGHTKTIKGKLMGLNTTPVAKCLDKKLVIFGYEIPDLLCIFLTLSILNFIFGNSSHQLLLVWIPSLLLAALLRFGKEGKPDNYLIHLIRSKVKPNFYEAFSEPHTNPVPQSHFKHRKAKS